MILSPHLDYQLMEHWAPTMAELVAMEKQEEAEAEALRAPQEEQSRFSAQAPRLSPLPAYPQASEMMSEG